MEREPARALARRWRWTLRTSLVAGGLAAALSWALPATWESTVVLVPPDRRTDEFAYSGGQAAGFLRTLEALHLRDRTHPAEIYRAVLGGDDLARRLVRRFDLAARWRTDEESAVARLSRSLTTRLHPYGPVEVRIEADDRELAADLANGAALVLEERLAELYREDVEWERQFLADAIAAQVDEAERLGVDLAEYRLEYGLVDREEQRDEATDALRDLAVAISGARIDRADQARRHGRGSPAARDAARRVEELERVAASAPTVLSRATQERIREEDLARLEESTHALRELRQQTFAHQAGHSVGVRVLDPAVPAEAPDRSRLVAAVLLAALAVPGSVFGRTWARRGRSALAEAGKAPGAGFFLRLARVLDVVVDPRSLAPRLRTPVLVVISALAGVTFAHAPLVLAGLLGVAFVIAVAADRTLAWFLLLIALPWAWDWINRSAGVEIQLPTEPGIILLVASWAWATLLRGKIAPPPRSLALPIAALLAWMALSAIPSLDPRRSFSQLVSTTGLILGGALYPMCEIRRLETLERMLTVYLVSGALVAVYGLVQVFTSPLPFDRAGTYMGEGILYNHGPYAAFLGFALGPAYVYLLRAEGGHRSGWLLATATLMTFATIVSVTRAAWVATLALLAILAVTRWRRSVRSFAVPVLASASLLAGLVALSPRIGKELSEYVEVGASADYGSNVERLNRWLAGWRMVSANPIFGVGPSAYEVAYPSYREVGYVTGLSDIRMGAHSDLVRVVAEQGVPGLLVLGWLVGAFYATGLRLARRGASPRIRTLAAALCAGVFTYTVHGVFNEYWRLPKIVLTLWAYVGALGALERIDAAARTGIQAGPLSPERPI